LLHEPAETAERLPTGFGYDWTGMTYQDLPPAGEETVASIFALVFP
jgi:HAE1 family hydrophobic/amphiphilic exporter-1